MGLPEPAGPGKGVSGRVEFVELGPLSVREWVDLTGHERAPFGLAAAGLVFRPKDRHLAVRDADDRLVAAVGLAVATVEVEGHEPFEVVGVGALIVHESARGGGLGAALIERVKRLVEDTGPDRAMLFCRAELMPLYGRVGYRPVEAPVRVDQPDGPVEMPIPAMWRPLRPVEWPAGAVRLRGLPF